MIRFRFRERKFVARWCQGPRIQIGALSIWSRVNSGGHNVLSWHNTHSITWRWLWYVRWQRRDGGRFFHFHMWMKPYGDMTFLIGPFQTGIHWQPTMLKKGSDQ